MVAPSCAAVRGLAAASIDGPLRAGDADTLGTHVRSCLSCASLVRDLRADAVALDRIQVGRPSEAVLLAVVDAARASRTRRTRPWPALVAAAIAVLVLGAGFVVGGGVPTTRFPLPDAARLAWSQLDARSGIAAPRHSSITTVASARGIGTLALAAAGTIGPGAGMWITTDGAAWRLVDGKSFDRGHVHALAGGSGRLVGVGSMISENGDPGAGVWWSADGTSWQSRSLATTQELDAIVAGPSGFVAAGVPRGANGAVIWRSTDGSSWTAVEDQTPFNGAVVTALVRHGDAFVAVGYGDRGGVAWTSRDGVAWVRATDDAVFEHGRVWSVTSSEDAIVAVGFDARGAAVWRSADGDRWTRTDLPSDLEGSRLRSVATTPVGFVAVGFDGAAPVSLVSDDAGVTWRHMPGTPWPEDAALQTIAAVDGGVVAAGSLDDSAVLWRGDRR
ncbi:MAG: WD40/YVTN/BNR-like repeat-containing protein [Chloroflexota bacterium]